jgi:hypothetical protein
MVLSLARRLSAFLRLPQAVPVLVGLAGVAQPSCNQAPLPDELMGGQSGDGSGVIDEPTRDEPSEASIAAVDGDCTNDRKPVDDVDAPLDELGFAPSDLLAVFAEPFETSVEWDPGGEFGYEPEPRESTLRMTVTYDGGPVALAFYNPELVSAPTGEALDEGAATSGSVPAPLLPAAELKLTGVGAPAPDAGAPGPGEMTSSYGEIPCPPVLEMDVEVALETNDGALDETFTATLRASSSEVLSLTATLDADDLNGALDLMNSPLGAPLRRLHFDATVSRFGTTGWLSPEFGSGDAEGSDADSTQIDSERTEIGGAGFGGAQVAVWPAAGSCPMELWGERHLPVVDEAELWGFTALEGKNTLANLSALPMRWEGGEESELRIDVRPLGEACVRVDRYGSRTELFAAVIDLETGDGAMVVEHQAVVEISPTQDDTGVQGANVSVQIDDLEPTEAAATLGMAELELDGVDAIAFSFWMFWDPSAQVAEGSFHVWGSVEVECPSGGNVSEPDQAAAEPRGSEQPSDPAAVDPEGTGEFERVSEDCLGTEIRSIEQGYIGASADELQQAEPRVER